MCENDKWKILNEIIFEEEMVPVYCIHTNHCSHKSTTRMTEFKVCCVECGLVIFEPIIPFAYYIKLNKKMKQERCQMRKLEKASKYKKINDKNEVYKSLVEFLGKKKLYLFYKSKVEKLFSFLFV